jgi:hypothetical protein
MRVAPDSPDKPSDDLIDNTDQPIRFCYKVDFPNPRYKNVQALDPFVENFLRGFFTDECRRKGHDGVRVLGYSRWSKGDFTIRSHPSFMGNIWYDWVLADYREQGETVATLPEASRNSASDMLNKDKLNKYFGDTDHLAMSRTDDNGYLAWYEELVPAKVVGLVTFEYFREGDVESAFQEEVCPEKHRLVVHCAQEREPEQPPKRSKGSRKSNMPSRREDTPLLSQHWEMEYLKDNNPALRLVEPENISGTVLVREDKPDRSPFIPKDQLQQDRSEQTSTKRPKKQRVNKDKGVNVYSIFDRKDSWPRQFIASTEQLSIMPEAFV